MIDVANFPALRAMRICYRATAKASVFTIVVVALLTGVFFELGRPAWAEPLSMGLMAAMVAAFVTVTFLLFWGIPLHIIFVKLHKHSVGWYLLAGFVSGPIFVYLFAPFGSDPFLQLLYQAIFSGLIGTVGSTLFWYIAVHKHRITSGSSTLQGKGPPQDASKAGAS